MSRISTEEFDALEAEIRDLVNERPRDQLESLWSGFDFNGTFRAVSVSPWLSLTRFQATASSLSPRLTA
jgi:hypothetical protein